MLLSHTSSSCDVFTPPDTGEHTTHERTSRVEVQRLNNSARPRSRQRLVELCSIRVPVCLSSTSFTTAVLQFLTHPLLVGFGAYER